jgi:hypothetical protein
MMFDLSWDVMAYHLPFSAKIIGQCSSDCFTLSSDLEIRYNSFPKAIHFLQGVIWYLTGAVTAVNMVNVTAFLVFLAYLQRTFSVNWAMAAIALMAIPMVQIHLTSSYIDLVTNIAASIAVLSLFDLFRSPDSFNTRKIILLALSIIIMANSKLQMIGLATFIIFMSSFLMICRGTKGIAGIRLTNWRKWGAAFGIIFAVSLAALANPIANTVKFHNPFYPITIQVGPLALPGPELPTQSVSIPDPLKTVPSPIRWILSVLEVSAYSHRFQPWTVDQGSVLQSSESFRMGGYFSFYVILNIMFLIYQIQQFTGQKRVAAVGFGLLTLLTAFLPLAHELRYYMYWMICLTSLNLITIYDGGLASNCKEGKLVFGLGSLAAFLAVVSVTGASYIKISRDRSIEHIVKADGIRSFIQDNVKDGDTLCIYGAAPREFLYARIFHPGRNYRVVVNGAEDSCNVTLKKN